MEKLIFAPTLAAETSFDLSNDVRENNERRNDSRETVIEYERSFVTSTVIFVTNER